MAPSFSFPLTSSPALFFLGPALSRTKRPAQRREARLLIIVLIVLIVIIVIIVL